MATTKSSPKSKRTVKKDSTVAPAPTLLQSPLASQKRTVIVVVILLLLVAAYLGRGLFVAAIVNGKPISRLEVVSNLEKHSGKNVLESLITQNLILQEAKKKNVEVSDKEIDAEVKKVEDSVSTQGQSLDTLLKAQGTSREDFRQQMKLQKTVEKLFGQDIQVSDKEVDDFIAKNKESMPQGATEQSVRPAVKEQLVQQKLSAKVSELIKKLREEAKINYFVTY